MSPHPAAANKQISKDSKHSGYDISFETFSTISAHSLPKTSSNGKAKQNDDFV